MTIEELLKSLKPCCGIIGIDPNLYVHGGYDEEITVADNRPCEGVYDDDIWLEEWTARQLPSEQRILLAEEMLRRWAAYRDAAREEGTPHAVQE